MKTYNHVDPIVNKWYVDDYGNKYSVKKENEEYIIVDGRVVLNELPDPVKKIEIDNMVEIPLKDNIISPIQFKVDYTNGFMAFHEDLNGDKITVLSYYARGLSLIPANRVYLELDQWGEVHRTMEDLNYTSEQIKELIKIFPSLLKTVSDSESSLEISVKEAESLIVDLTRQLDGAEITIGNLTTEISQSLENSSTTLDQMMEYFTNNVSEKQSDMDEYIGNIETIISINQEKTNQLISSLETEIEILEPRLQHIGTIQSTLSNTIVYSEDLIERLKEDRDLITNLIEASTQEREKIEGVVNSNRQIIDEQKEELNRIISDSQEQIITSNSLSETIEELLQRTEDAVKTLGEMLDGTDLGGYFTKIETERLLDEKVDLLDFEEHTGYIYNNPKHGLRVVDSKLEYFDGNDWIIVEQERTANFISASTEPLQLISGDEWHREYN